MRSRNTPEWALEQQRSISFFPEDLPQNRIGGGMWEHMFTEDIRLGLLPYERLQGTPYSIRLEPLGNEDVIVQIFSSATEWRRASLKESVADFVEQIAGYLAHAGEAWYEIIRQPGSLDANSAPFALEPLPSGKITRVPGYVLQWIPRASRPRIGKRFVRLPQHDVWHVTLPRALGTPRQHRRTLEFLEQGIFPPLFSVEAMAPGRESGGYDFDEHRRRFNESLAYVTRAWGWTGRGLWMNEASDYFSEYRNLRFKRSQILLRDHIFHELNVLLEREGLPDRILTNGLLTLSEIDDILKRLWSGNVRFDEVLATLRR